MRPRVWYNDIHICIYIHTNLPTCLFNFKDSKPLAVFFSNSNGNNIRQLFFKSQSRQVLNLWLEWTRCLVREERPQDFLPRFGVEGWRLKIHPIDSDSFLGSVFLESTHLPALPKYAKVVNLQVHSILEYGRWMTIMTNTYQYYPILWSLL